MSFPLHVSFPSPLRELINTGDDSGNIARDNDDFMDVRVDVHISVTSILLCVLPDSIDIYDLKAIVGTGQTRCVRSVRPLA